MDFAELTTEPIDITSVARRVVPEECGATVTLDGYARRFTKDKATGEVRETDRIGRELDDRGITTPAAIGKALGMPAPEATKLLTRHQWREGDVALLESVAARLSLQPV